MTDHRRPPRQAGRPGPPSRRLPRLLVLTDRRQARGSLLDTVRAAVEAGARAVVLREKDLPRAQRCDLAAACAPVVAGVGGVLLSAGERLPGTDGVHLPAEGAFDRAGTGIVGRSCHDTGELGRAEADGVDYVTLSPIFSTRSKPGYGPAIGTGGLERSVASTGLPVYALGGIDGPAAAAACRAAGAHGVAVMGAVMRHPRPGRLVSELLAAAGETVG